MPDVWEDIMKIDVGKFNLRGRMCAHEMITKNSRHTMIITRELVCTTNAKKSDESNSSISFDGENCLMEMFPIMNPSIVSFCFLKDTMSE